MCLIDHRQWHLWYDILENKKFDVKKLTENIGSVYYCHKFDPFKCLVWRGLATPLYGSSSVYWKVLGLNWDTRADDFIFDFENICCTAEKLNVTKRNILRITAMFFDILGLISPFTLQPKLIFQELRRNKLEWHKVINDKNNIKKWTKFLHDLRQFHLIKAKGTQANFS